jgi:hypothetical protein
LSFGGVGLEFAFHIKSKLVSVSFPPVLIFTLPINIILKATMNNRTAGDTKDLMLSYQEGLSAMLESLRQLESHLRNIQARTFQMTEEISYLVDDNLRLLRSVNKQVSLTTSSSECVLKSS